MVDTPKETSKDTPAPAPQTKPGTGPKPGAGAKPESNPAPGAKPQPAANPGNAEPAEEFGGRGGLDPTRYGDWEKDGRCVDF